MGSIVIVDPSWVSVISEGSVVEVRIWVVDFSTFASEVVDSTSVVSWATVVVFGVFDCDVVVSGWTVDDAIFLLVVVGGNQVVDVVWVVLRVVASFAVVSLVVVVVASCCLVVGIGVDVVLRVVWNLVGVIVDVLSIFVVVVEGAVEVVSLLFATKRKNDNHLFCIN